MNAGARGDVKGKVRVRDGFTVLSSEISYALENSLAQAQRQERK